MDQITFCTSPPLGGGLRKRNFPKHQTANYLMTRARKLSELIAIKDPYASNVKLQSL